jgi:choloylglycine hydrolase
MKKIMIKWRIFLTAATLLLFAAVQQATACTIFELHDRSQTLVAHGFDWDTGKGHMVINKRGLEKSAVFTGTENPVRWRSRFGSLTIGWVGQDMPTIGMNEKGFLAASLLLEGSRFPDADPADTRATISQVLVKQYLLDTWGSVEEALAVLAKTRIMSTSRYGIHYFLADAGGNAATVDMLDGRKDIHHGSDLPIPALTNSAYTVGLAALKSSGATDRKTDVYGIATSEVRFASAARSIEAFAARESGDDVAWAYAELDKVKKSQPPMAIGLRPPAAPTLPADLWQPRGADG